jgi:hypothetical protein
MRAKSILFSLFILFFFLLSCNQPGVESGKVKVVNKLNRNIVCLLGYNYPDLSFGFTSKQSVMAKANQFEIGVNQNKEVDTLGLCKKKVWDSNIKHSMLMLFVFDKNKLSSSDKLEDALIEREYFTYEQLMKTNGIITVSDK